jgi:hypothetical protein
MVDTCALARRNSPHGRRIAASGDPATSAAVDAFPDELEEFAAQFFLQLARRVIFA